MKQLINKKPTLSQNKSIISFQRHSSTSPESWWGKKTITMYKGWLIFENIPDYIIDQEIDDISGYDYESLEKRRQIWVLFKMTDRSLLKKKLELLKVYIYIKYDPNISHTFLKSLNKNLNKLISTLDPWTLVYIKDYITETKIENDDI